MEQPLFFFRSQLAHRNAGPHRDHFGDIFSRNLGLVGAAFKVQVQVVQGVFQVLGQVELFRPDVVFLHPFKRILAHGGVARPAYPVGQLRRKWDFIQANPGRGLVDQVDGFIRHKPFRHVARGQMRRGDQGLVGDLQVVVSLVTAADTFENFDGFLDGRFFDHHRLEAALQGRVSFDILAILVQGGRADTLQLAPGQGRLQDIGRIDRTPGRPGADQHVQLVDKQDGPGFFDFVDDALQPLFKLAAVHGAGHQRAHVQHHYPFTQQRVRRFAIDDTLGQPFYNGCFADTRLADQRRVIFGPAGQDLDDPLDFHLAPDHRIEFAGFRLGGQVRPQLVDQGRSFRLPVGAGGRLGRAFHHHPRRLRPDFVQANSQPLQNIHRHAFAGADQPEQQVLGADIMVPQAPGFVDCQLDDPLGARGQAQFAVHGPLAPAHGALYALADLLGINP